MFKLNSISIKNLPLFLIPFVIVGVILFLETINSYFESQKTFEENAKTTTSLYEIDISNFEKAKVVKVVDGDTIEIESGERVRYLGIDTPETVHPTKKVQCFGREASNKNKELVLGKEVLLEKDISDRDRYGRLLRYVYLSNETNPQEVLMVNEYLIELGFATVVTYPPDVKYKDRFLKQQRQAQDSEKGLWGSCKSKY